MIQYTRACLKKHSQHPHSPLCTLKGMIRIILPKFSQCSPLYHALWVHLLNSGNILHIMPFRVQTVKHIIPFGYICQKAFFKHALEQVCYTPIAATHFPLIPQDVVYCFMIGMCKKLARIRRNNYGILSSNQ